MGQSGYAGRGPWVPPRRESWRREGPGDGAGEPAPSFLGAPTSAPAGILGATALVHLQREVGNRAVGGLVPGPGRVVVQRHSSWEHAMLGDVPPAQLGQAAVTPEARKHVIASLWDRTRFFQDDPHANPTTKFPDVRWFQLKASKLWVSNGELNALGDYLPDPTAYDTLGDDVLVPVLQKMRSGILSKANEEFGLRDDDMQGAADDWLPGAAGEVRAIDKATEDLGVNRYKGLVSRNACHFAPFSWQRWAEFHNQAADEARLHHQLNTTPTPLSVVDTGAEEHERQALLNAGYGDHFVQDSFAAGHLVNKTLVMQWFVDYINGLSWVDKPWVGLPDDDTMARMGSAQQPGVAGLDRYGSFPSSSVTSADDRRSGTGATDPQSAQERTDYERRMTGSGVSGEGAEQVANYQAYLKFLNSAFLQLAAGAAHDYFNEHGLTVMNTAGTKMRVGGDDTLLSQSDQVGAETAAQAAAMSRQAIEDILQTGTTDKTVDAIMQLVPTLVEVELPLGSPMLFGLELFQTDVVKQLCEDELFPELLESMKGRAVRLIAPEMVSGGISVDVGAQPPPQMGDFPEGGGGTSAVG